MGIVGPVRVFSFRHKLSKMSDDWDKVTVIGKRQTTQKQLKSTSALNQASRQGGQIISEKKTGLNQSRTTEGSKIAKQDRLTDEGVFEVNKVSGSVSKAIQDGRRLKSLTQKDLATKINEKVCLGPILGPIPKGLLVSTRIYIISATKP
jgi:Multiprotein bridging factor 1